MVPFGTPEVQASLKTLLAAGEAAMEWRKAVTAIDTEIITTQGIPTYRGGFTKAPFDIIGDTMRGTRPMMFDLFRHRDKVIETVERLVPMATQLGVRTATLSRNPMVFIPLHKGVDSFMSNKDFETFYWPTLKSVVLGLIEEGCVPMLFVEGAYNSRLDILSRAEIPAGRTIWVFEHTEMAEAKVKVGPWGCIGGNVPGSLLQVGTPEEVDAYVKDLLGKVAGDGGFILGTGLSLSDASAENFRAMVEAGGKYGS
jgi:uroporphyrinogen-III decarboxylase